MTVPDYRSKFDDAEANRIALAILGHVRKADWSALATILGPAELDIDQRSFREIRIARVMTALAGLSNTLLTGVGLPENEAIDEWLSEWTFEMYQDELKNQKEADRHDQ